ncbi:MAG: class I tRNA ligase family protein, partial [Planctomycetota bacterium]
IGDLSISRASLGWGVPMPGDSDHVLYVWIDALSNYITALGYGSDEAGDRYDTFWPVDVHLIGKEIIWFHTVYWPAMLMSIDAALPKQVFAHGWWVSEGKKMSKSLGNFVGLEKLRAVTDHYGLDALRYYLLWAAPFGSDLDWQDGELHRSYLELANVVGNGLNRVLKMTGKYRDGVLADPAPGTTDDDRKLIDATAKLAGDVAAAYRDMRLQDAVTLPVELAREMNGYIDRTEPFKLAKDESQAARLDAVLYHAASAMRQVLAALLPVLPEKAAAGLDQLKLPATLAQSTPLQAGHQLGEGQPLFPRLDPMGEP